MTTQSLFINGKWTPGQGPVLQSFNPANKQVIWEGATASQTDVEASCQSAQQALQTWSALAFEERFKIVQNFSDLLNSHKDELAELISKENGKPFWEAKTEVGAMVGKAKLSEQAFKERCQISERDMGDKTSFTRYKPLGVVAVFGPFNFPGHLANGHIIPALLAGNTVVFKPSELTPAVAEFTVQLWEKAGLPKGVLNLVQGNAETAKALLNNKNLRGVFFTGSSRVGKIISKELADRPEVLLALEMGGNNPLVIHNIKDIKAAAFLTVQSAFITAGQRCTCARRLLVVKDDNTQNFLDQLKKDTQSLKVSAYNENPEPFMGPVINAHAATAVLKAQEELIKKGAQEILPVRLLKEDSAFLSPGLIDITNANDLPDEEIFGPLLQIKIVSSLDEAIQEANNSKYGLAAGIITPEKNAFEIFYNNVHAGLINWNTQLTGASSAAPFGGIGDSGNHRPSAYFAADYCSYPIASLEAKKIEMPETLPPGFGESS